jgi:hypothetical protein
MESGNEKSFPCADICDLPSAVGPPSSDLRCQQAGLHAGGAQRIKEKARDRHRPDAARHRGNGVGHFKRLGKIDITDDAEFAA